MLRGNHPARIDDKGRLKIPAPFQEELARSYSDEFWVTSTAGRFAEIYPMEEWKKVEEKILLSTATAARRKYLRATNYFGQVVKWDKQGRILIPSLLRDKAEIKGDVAVIGGLTFLTVWNNERYVADLDENPVTEEDLSALGI
jgi:MraZ protein